MNKRCRLLLTTKCPNNCPLCCNKQFDLLKEVPVIDRWDYDEFILTGGEPLMGGTVRLLDFIYNLTAIHKYMGTTPKIFLYTSECKPDYWNRIMPYLDGITYTVHTEANAQEFLTLLKVLSTPEVGYDVMYPDLFNIGTKSLWLNLFPEAKQLIADKLATTNLSWDTVNRFFKIRPMEWKENCPVPEGEDFRRLESPW
jgi:hypothetical protein